MATKVLDDSLSGPRLASVPSAARVSGRGRGGLAPRPESTAQTFGINAVSMSRLNLDGQGVVRVGRDSCAGADATRASVAIGHGSPSADTGVTRLDLNDILIGHRQATLLMRVAGIDSGDLMLVDRAIPPSHGHVVIAVVDEEFVCRRLCRQGRDIRLRAPRPGVPTWWQARAWTCGPGAS